MEAWVRPQDSVCEIYSGQSGIGKGFSSSALVFPVIFFILMLHTHLHLYATVVIGISEESSDVSTVWEPRTEVCLHCFFQSSDL
jgi:hypothetical protein